MSRGDIVDLVINIPPGMLKSLTVSVFWPAWEWTGRPDSRWLFSSYAEQLSMRDAVKSRRLIASDWYQQRWGDVFRLTSDQNEKKRYENDKTGFRVATSVGGVGTGERGDRVVADDPHNVKQGESQLIREGVVLWWSEVMSTRKNDPERSTRVVIMQRVHTDDVTAWCLDHGFEHLCLPMEYEGENRTVTSLGFVDPRTEQNELLMPQYISRQLLETKLKLELGPYGTAGQLQQRPYPRGGGLFKRDWFELVDGTPGHVQRVRYWDKGGTEGGGAYTAGVLMARCNRTGLYYVEHVERGQWAAMQRETRIRQTAETDRARGGVQIWVEQEPGSGGKDSAQATIRNLEGFPCRAERPTGDKFARADPLAAAAEAGLVKLVRGAWNEAFLDELEAARPEAAYLDQMDAAAGAYNKLAQAGQARGVQPISLRQANPFLVE